MDTRKIQQQLLKDVKTQPLEGPVLIDGNVFNKILDMLEEQIRKEDFVAKTIEDPTMLREGESTLSPSWLKRVIEWQEKEIKDKDNKIVELEKQLDLFWALEAAGVDNWDGYPNAIEILEGRKG